MRLSDIEICIGVVIDKDDPMKEGRLRIAAPGVFEPVRDKDVPDDDTSTIRYSDVPWASPLMVNFQNYSQLIPGCKVWLIHNVNNMFSYWYLPFFELNANTKKLIDNKEMDVLISRVGDVGDAQLYYKNSEGIVNKVGDGHVIVHKSGDIHINGPEKIEEYAPKISIGNKENTFYSALIGEETVGVLGKITGVLTELANSMITSPYTAAVGLKLQSSLINAQLDNAQSNDTFNKILSNTVTVSK